MDALRAARDYLDQYQHRINQDTYYGNDRLRYENCAYQEGMLSAAIAQAEQAKRIADMMEAYLESEGYWPLEESPATPNELQPLNAISDPASDLDNF